MTYRTMLLSIALLMGATHSEAAVFARIKETNFTPNRACDPMVRALILHDVDSASVEVVGHYMLVDPKDGSLISPPRVRGKLRDFEPLASGLKWGEEFPDRYQVKIIPSREDGHVAVNGVVYPGSITVYDVGGSISIVNEVPIEDYIMETLGPQLPTGLSPEALNAIVITARTDAYYQATHGRSPYWDVDSTSVGYHGLADLGTIAEPLEAAIQATRYMVMTLPSQDAQVAVFPAKWERAVGEEPAATGRKGPVLTVAQATSLSDSGANAAQILAKVFPNIYIQRIFQASN